MAMAAWQNSEGVFCPVEQNLMLELPTDASI